MGKERAVHENIAPDDTSENNKSSLDINNVNTGATGSAMVRYDAKTGMECFEPQAICNKNIGAAETDMV